MKLSRLVYLCIKNVNYYDDDSFTYDYFVTNGISQESNYSDYSVAIKNVYTPLNEAIQRLSDMEKIPYKIVEATPVGNLVDVSSLDVKVKEVVNVATTNYERLPFANYGLGRIRLLRPYLPIAKSVFGSDVSSNKVLIEYKEEIPTFNEDETFPSLDDTTNDGDFDFEDGETILNEKEMADYGINNAMCQYIIEYVQGKLEEQVDPTLANMHITRAEQYFSNLKPVSSAFNQEKVYKKYGIE